MVDCARKKLEVNLYSSSTPYGCLDGDLDDYVSSFQPVLDKFRARMDQQRQLLEEEANGYSKASNKEQVALFKEALDKMKTQLEEVLKPAKIVKVTLEDLQNWGE